VIELENVREFKRALGDFSGTIEQLEVELRTVAGIAGLNAIVAATPRKTGRAQGGWWLEHDPTPFGLTVIGNNVEYILPLEDGHSDQAPGGMTAAGLAVIGYVYGD
jgi:hypothetical protein